MLFITEMRCPIIKPSTKWKLYREKCKYAWQPELKFYCSAIQMLVNKTLYNSPQDSKRFFRILIT